MSLQIKYTGDGSVTLFIPEINEQYHSMNGAITESNHVFIANGFHFHPSKKPVVFEVGFGTGLNCLLTAHQAEIQKRPSFYIAIEKFELSSDIIHQLNYDNFIPENGKQLFERIHSCRWDVPDEISPWFTLLKLKADFTEEEWTLPRKCDIVYFDAFGPDKQPEMWSEEIFLKLYGEISDNGVLVTYSAKGEVRRRLLSAGFSVYKLPGPPGKKEMLRAIKTGLKI